MSAPFAVPNDDQTPYPITFDRLLKAFSDKNFQLEQVSEGRVAGAMFDTTPFLIMLDTSNRFITIRAMWAADIPLASSTQQVFAAADSWNREMYFPTVYSMPDEDGNLQVCADFSIDTIAGISNDQLSENMDAGIAAGLKAIEYMKQAAEQTLGWTDPRK